MIVVMEFLLMILIIASCITIKFKFKQENSILITFLSITLLTYVLGLFNVMNLAFYIVIILDILGIGYILYSGIKKKIKWSELFTVGTVIYIFVSILLGIVLKNTYFTQWDEFSHWGSNLKAMVANDLLWSNNKWDGIHVVYQPLAGIIEYWFCKLNGGFSESVAYIGIDIAMCTLLLPMLRNLKYTIKDLVKGILFVFSIFCLICLFRFSLTSIYIDLLLGIMFAIGVYIAIHTKKLEDKILLILILIAMVELKTTGLLLDGIILMILFFKKVVTRIVKDKKITKKAWANLIKLILILVLLLVAYMSWSIYCKANDRVLDEKHDNNFITEINIKEFVKAIIQYNCNNEKLQAISSNFYQALNEKQIIFGLPVSTTIGILATLNIIMIGIYRKEEDKEEKENILVQILSFDIGFILYSFLLMATFMFAFTDREGRSLASFERYMSTFFIAWIVNVIAHFLRKVKTEKVEKGEKSSGLTAMLIIALIGLYGMNIQTLIHPIQKNNSAIPSYIQEKADIVTSTLKSEDKVYVIFQDCGYRVDPFVFRYCISPIVMNLMNEYNLGKLDPADNTLTYDITEQEWEQKLIDENYDYVFILRSDEEFKETYKEAFEKDTDFEQLDDKIFKVNKIDNNNVLLTLYQ